MSKTVHQRAKVQRVCLVPRESGRDEAFLYHQRLIGDGAPHAPTGHADCSEEAASFNFGVDRGLCMG